MLTASEQIARTAAHIVARWDPAVFTPAVGDPVPLKVNVEQGTELQPGGLEAQAWGTATTVEYLLSDIGRETDKDEFFTMDAGGAVYTVQAIEENKDGFVKAIVT
jgi:hypothetical protein